MALLKCSVFLLFLLIHSSFARYEEYFYWRIYNGTIPNDAIPGGTTCIHGTTFIGANVVKEIGLLVSTIYPNEIYQYSYGGGLEFKTGNFGLILCADPALPPIWKPIQNGIIPENCHPIKGGEQLSKILYIGRISIKGIYHVGKVTEGNYISYWSEKDKKQYDSQNFEILAYCEGE